MRYGIGGAGLSEYKLIISLSILIILSSFFLPLFGLFYSAPPSVKKPAGRAWITFILLLLAAFAASPTTYGLLDYYVDVNKSGDLSEADFYKSYLRPNSTANGPHPNLVYIYAESLERTYFNESIFPGLIKYLRYIESISTSFVQIKEIVGTQWTIAGIVATQCGIPLSTPSHGNSMSGMDRFLPNAICTGDLLSKNGYNLSYLSGSSLNFAGTGNFFQSHGFNDIVGIDELKKDIDASGWGLHDDILFEIASEKFQSLSEKDKPFGLFISTLDTHNPYGRKSAACKNIKYKKGNNTILNAVACSDYLIAEFILKIWKSEFGKNTVIVITSDHLAMRNTATSLLESGERNNLFIVFDPRKADSQEKGVIVEKKGTMLDVMPTLMPFLGFDTELGLGRNLLSDELPLISKYDGFNLACKAWEKQLQSFWGFPNLDLSQDVFTIDPSNKQLTFNKRSFSYPLLLEFDQQGETTFRFSFDISMNQKTLSDHVLDLDESKYFLWIDLCANIDHHEVRSDDACCVAYGKGAAPLIKFNELTHNVELPVHKIISGQPISDATQETPLNSGKSNYNVNRFIAHAGGKLDGNVYTNSLEALNQNYANGFRIFELDIVKTSDNHFVAAHDWEHWQKITGYKENIPPTLEAFKKQKIMNKYTPMTMDDINRWFSAHPDAILVTDKVNAPLDFSDQFVDKERLMMELFTMESLQEGIKANIKSAMPNWDLVMSYEGDKIKWLTDLGVTEIVASRKVLEESNMPFIRALKEKGIKMYVYHVNFEPGKDETYVFCHDMKIIYGMYADEFDFSSNLDCSQIEFAPEN